MNGLNESCVCKLNVIEHETAKLDLGCFCDKGWNKRIRHGLISRPDSDMRGLDIKRPLILHRDIIIIFFLGIDIQYFIFFAIG